MLNVVSEFIVEFLGVVCTTGFFLGLVCKACKIIGRAFSKGELML